MPNVAPPLRPPLQTLTLPSLPLDCGTLLTAPSLAYRQYGEFDRDRSNVVLVLHALTGSSDVDEWWPGLIGPGCAIDTDVFAVIAPNHLGSCYGSSGPRDGGDAFPPISTRDQARAIGVLLERLRVPALVLVTGGSLGGMIALELIAGFPRRARQALVFAAPARQTAWGLGCNAVQRAAVHKLGADGLELARAAAMLTYRTPDGLERRFGARRDATGTSEVTRWLTAHGEKFRVRFDQASYVALLDAMDAHDVGRGGLGGAERLRASAAAITAVGIAGDLLYPASVVEGWARDVGAEYVELKSDHGHDALLTELDQVQALLRFALTPGRELEAA